MESYANPRAADAYDGEGLRAAERYIFDHYFADAGKVLDLGCGTGRTSRHLARRGHEVTAIDYSPTMLERARQRSNGFNIHLSLMDAVALGFSDCTFDYCLFAHNGLDYLHPRTNRAKALGEIFRVLKPGGLLAFSSHNCLWIPTRPADILNVLKSALRFKFAPYRWDYASYGQLYTHFISPTGQVKELQHLGFTSVKIVSQHSLTHWKITVLDPFPSYVCHRPM